MFVTAFAEVESEARPVREVLADIYTALEGIGMQSDESDWSATFQPPGAVWPRARWIASYVVMGTNEGWYAHLDVIPVGIGGGARYEEAAINMAIAKFWDRDLAFEYCKLTMQLLEGR